MYFPQAGQSLWVVIERLLGNQALNVPRLVTSATVSNRKCFDWRYSLPRRLLQANVPRTYEILLLLLLCKGKLTIPVAGRGGL
jgi:hypothetical protein